MLILLLTYEGYVIQRPVYLIQVIGDMYIRRDGKYSFTKMFPKPIAERVVG
jgi:hypothetical protein